MIESNYFALQLASKLGSTRNADVYSPFFGHGSVATMLLNHAAQSAYFMEDKKYASDFYEKAVAKVMNDFCLKGDRTSRAEMRYMQVKDTDISLIKQHYEYQLKLDKNGSGELNKSFRLTVEKSLPSVTLSPQTIMLFPTPEAGVQFSCINLQNGRILYEQPNEGNYKCWTDGFIIKQDNEIFRSLIEYLENTLN